MAAIEVIRTSAEVNALVPEWVELWRRDPNAKPFQRPEWLLSWWHHFGQSDLHIVCIRQGGRLIGLLPFYVYFDNPKNERQLLLVGAGTSDYLDGLFSPECTAAEACEGLVAIADGVTWDVAHLMQVLPHSPIYSGVIRIGAPAVEQIAGESCFRCRALPIAELPRKVRSDVRYFRSAALGRGTLRLHLADASSCKSCFEVLVDLHSARWRESGEAGVLSDPNVLGWHFEAVPLLEAAGCLRLYVLYLDAEPIASLYALVDPPTRSSRTEYFYLIGYSPAYAEIKPGTLITAMASEYAANEGVEFIDMLRGNEAYKKFWHVKEVPTYGISIARSALARH
jgi:CelD/BcsL family acetyltransferase involved in cellulose biosynthesis